jgi:exopolysaccharide production protein ExoY
MRKSETPSAETALRPLVAHQATSELIKPAAPSARRVAIIGSAGDVPRALVHPAVLAGRMLVVAALAVEVDEDESAEAIAQLTAVLEAQEPEAILIAGPVGNPAMRRVADLALMHGCELLAVMPTEVPAGHDPVVVWSGDSPLVQLARKPRRVWHAAAKRVVDVVGAGLGLIVLSPALVALCALIRIESPGWPLFAHERVGYRGRRFRCYKLRTMRANAEHELKADPAMYEEYRRNHFKIPDRRDPRTTRVGRFLRRTSLDELPQLWNVFVGDMSLVGPRPVVSEELQMYGELADLLVSVRPGLTGAWAVSGRHDVGYPERCRIELGYVRGYSLRTDLNILSRTLQAVLRPGGETPV